MMLIQKGSERRAVQVFRDESVRPQQGIVNATRGSVIQPLFPGRRETHFGSVDDFLHIGYTIGLDKFKGFLFAWSGFFDGDNTLYVGLVPLLFLFYALIHVRDRFFAGILSVTVLLACLTLGDVSFCAGMVKGPL